MKIEAWTIFVQFMYFVAFDSPNDVNEVKQILGSLP